MLQCYDYAVGCSPAPMRAGQVGDIYMSLIHTTELDGGNAFHYLTALMRHDNAVADSPSEWLPWNYRESLARLDGRAHDPSTATDVVTSDSAPVLDMRGPPFDGHAPLAPSAPQPPQ